MRKTRVLYIDPDQMRRIHIGSMLRLAGLDYLSCSNLESGKLTFIQNGPFDYVICVSSVKGRSSGDGLLYLIELNRRETRQRVIVLMNSDVAADEVNLIPAVDSRSSTMVKELLKLLN